MNIHREPHRRPAVIRAQRVGENYCPICEAKFLGAENEALCPSCRRLSERKCLCCGKSFISTGPSNRMCDDCRNSREEVMTPQSTGYDSAKDKVRMSQLSIQAC